MSRKRHPAQEHYHCKRKQIYANEEAAQIGVDYIARTYGAKVRSYKCGYCSYYHIGKKPRGHAGDRLAKPPETGNGG